VADFVSLRSWIFSLTLIVRDQRLNEIPFISPTDAGMFALVGWDRSLGFLKRFKAYRNHLTDVNWCCLTSFYPRTFYILYYYLLFWWADYCNVLPEVINQPKRSLVAELFFRYIAEVDRIIDDPRNGVGMLMNPTLIKQHPEADRWLATFFSQLNQTVEQACIRREICADFWAYRNECLTACQNAQVHSQEGLQQILLCKQITSGGLFRTWSSMLGKLYCPMSSQELVDSAGTILSWACVAVQVHEDMMDLPIDMRGGIFNIFHEILKTHPEELKICRAYVERVPWQHLDDLWARQNLPHSYAEARELLTHYLDLALQGSLIRHKALELCQTFGDVNSHPMGL
jgi:hypothetical protein